MPPPVSTGHADVVKLLVSRSADKSCKDKQGYTPLHAAAASGHIEIVKYLLRMGAEVSESFTQRTNVWSMVRQRLILGGLSVRSMSPTDLETLRSTWRATWARRQWLPSWSTTARTLTSPISAATHLCTWLLSPPTVPSVWSCWSTMGQMSTSR